MGLDIAPHDDPHWPSPMTAHMTTYSPTALFNLISINYDYALCIKLNVNWEKIHSIILAVTCHGLGNFLLLIHIPSHSFMNFQNPTSYYFFELESLIKC